MAASFTAWEWFILVQHELLLFVGVFFLIGAIDEITVDLAWLWLKVTGRASTPALEDQTLRQHQLAGWAAVFIPAWQEDQVIGATIKHILASWPQAELRLYVGVYRNDGATLAAAVNAAQGDSRLRVVVNPADGPTTKADCLNRLYQALAEDELRMQSRSRMVLLHDAEDLVDPAALPLIDIAMEKNDLVQIPVLPLRDPASPLVSGHYCEEFAEAHGKTMVVRDALGASMPLAGVGCAISRDALDMQARDNEAGHPFAVGSLTEDYELGMGLSTRGKRAMFLRARASGGRLIAVRAYFPGQIEASVKQKTRWIHGVSLQGWDRIGWGSSLSEIWMRMRDRRSPFVALVLAGGYLALLMFGLALGLEQMGLVEPVPFSPLITAIVTANFVALIWRVGWRFAFTARNYGLAEGGLAIIRIPIANMISIMAGPRALWAYITSLFGKPVVWEKTQHDNHPTFAPDWNASIGAPLND